MNELYKSMSKGQKLLTNYITDNYDKAAFLTAAKLGETVGVSESTVVRFANAIGFSGYPELQKQLQEMVKTRLTTVQRIDMSNDYSTDESTLRNISYKVNLNLISNRTTSTLRIINKNDFINKRKFKEQ
jgi:DNA-binding MurR/RpiR family transcriptional regulator